ncbi:hypothetical protein [Sulfurimonas sp.]|uniref:hypothetical protein n=1 Tax=Sulfurimonas sp. TaxID=2022749 RepID=UPI0025F30165|nr:hypothetical protein [Sulfurimonas sp.]MBW6489141.1 hypothetical protein [Sulfurimonas sp.]
MKNLMIAVSVIIVLTSCSKVDGVNPSQNEALNSVTGKKEKKSGFMQQKLDKWLSEEWSPVVEGTKPPTGDTAVKIIENENGSAKLVEAKTGTVLKEISKEEVEKQKEVKEKYSKKDRNFTLQEYVDKMSVYSATHVTDEENSHVKRIDSMPVIGKK